MNLPARSTQLGSSASIRKPLRRTALVDLGAVAGKALVVALRQRAHPRGELVEIREPLGLRDDRRFVFGDELEDAFGQGTETSSVVMRNADHFRPPGGKGR